MRGSRRRRRRRGRRENGRRGKRRRRGENEEELEVGLKEVRAGTRRTASRGGVGEQEEYGQHEEEEEDVDCT